MDEKTPEAMHNVRHLILGTAGHIDHGKTALVRALTGTDTDRLPEEQKRGMTIELGFAELQLEKWIFGIVDVPGHERFVRTMVSGATAIDLAVLVIAADDSVMPQTIEHAEILSLLGVRHAVVAITKCDTVESDMVDMVIEDVRELLQDTSMEEAPIVPVSSVTGEGIENLKTAIVNTASGISNRPFAPPFHMSVDRAFTIQGRGTVVTGSVLRGTVSGGDTLDVHPGAIECRVRDLQAHGSHHEHLQTGQRAAINLIGIDREKAAKGCDLATPGYLEPARMLDAGISVLSTCRKSIKTSSRVRLCIGTRECIARIVPLMNSELCPGTTGYAQLRLGESITAVHGQRFILRDESATRTIAGGRILRPVAKRWLRDRKEEQEALDTLDSKHTDQRVEDVLRRAGFSILTDMQICGRSGASLEELPAIISKLKTSGRLAEMGNRRIAEDAIQDLCYRAQRWLHRYHTSNPNEPGCRLDAFQGWLDRKTDKGFGKPLLERMQKARLVKVLGRFACLPEFAPQLSKQDERVLAEILEEYRSAGLAPPKPSALKAASGANKARIDKLLKIADSTGQLNQISTDWYLHPEHESHLRESVKSLAEECGDTGITVSQIRERLDSSRKYVVPFVEYLDRIDFTKRDGDQRHITNSTDS